MNTPCFAQDDKSFAEDENDMPFPAINLPEKIVIVVDNAREQNCSPFRLSTDAKIMPLSMIKRVVENFVCIKSTIQRSHEFALMVLTSKGAQWVCDFTNNIKTIVNHLDVINEEFLEEDEKEYDLGPVFETMHSKLHLPSRKHNIVVPMFVYRVVLIYSRSNSLPKFHVGKTSLNSLRENPYLFVDLLYVHEPPSSDNSCQEIYTALADSVATSFSYVLEVGRNAAKLHDNMAMLLAHPLQRPPQKDACYTIFSSSIPLQGTRTNH